MKFSKTIFVILLILHMHEGLAAVDVHQFTNTEQRERFEYFVKNLRCPMCDNQNLEGSNSAISADLRDELARMINSGKTDQQIREFMRARYGDYIFYQPPVNSDTIWLWLIPLLLAGIALLVVWRIILSRRQLADNNISAAERAQARTLLDKPD